MLKAVATIAFALLFAEGVPAHDQLSPEAQALVDRAQKAWDTPPANYDPVLDRLFHRAVDLDGSMPVYQREQIVTTAEEALANKLEVAHFRALSAFYYPKDGGFVICGQGRYYRNGKEMNGAFVYTDMYGGIRIADATENAQKAYDCQSIANFQLR